MSPFRRVAAFAPDGATTLGLGSRAASSAPIRASPGFGCSRARSTLGRSGLDLGVTVQIEHGLGALRRAEVVLVLPADDLRSEPNARVLEALCAAHRRGATIAAHCGGALLLAAAGVLDGLEATTHW